MLRRRITILLFYFFKYQSKMFNRLKMYEILYMVPQKLFIYQLKKIYKKKIVIMFFIDTSSLIC